MMKEFKAIDTLRHFMDKYMSGFSVAFILLGILIEVLNRAPGFGGGRGGGGVVAERERKSGNREGGCNCDQEFLHWMCSGLSAWVEVNGQDS